MFAFRTIRGRLVAGFVALLVLLTGALTLVAIDRAEAALVEQIEATHTARAETLGRDLDLLAREALDAARTVGRSQGFAAGLPTDGQNANGTIPADNATLVRTVLEQAVAAQPAFAAATVLSPDGSVRMGHPMVHQWDAVAAADTANGQVLNDGLVARARGLDPFVTAGLQPGSFLFVAPVRDADNHFAGALAFDGDPAALEAIGRRSLTDDASDTSAALYVLDGRGIALTGADDTEGDDVGQQIAALDERTGIVNLQGQRHLVSVFELSATPWRMMIATETSEAFASVAGLIRITVVVGAIGLALAVATSLVFAHDLSAPVRRLQEGAERVTAGEYGTQVRVATRDEMSDLAGAFNAMSARLYDERRRLLAHQDTLADQVRERTTELAEKNEELEAFVYAASHDLRTPIISLDWLVSELEELVQQFDDADEASEQHQRARADVDATIQRLHTNVEGMDRLLADLLELSRIGRAEGDPAPVDVDEVVKQVLDEYADAIEEHTVDVTVDLEGRPAVLADPRRVHQMLHNLVGNAIKYGADTDPKIVLRTTPIGDPADPWKWRFEVRDNGPGVPKEQRERIFALFQRGLDPLGRKISGTGVGLAMVRKIARAYGGDCQAAAAPGGGALFWFTLPAARKSHQRAAQEQSVEARHPSPRQEQPSTAARPLARDGRGRRADGETDSLP